MSDDDEPQGIPLGLFGMMKPPTPEEEKQRILRQPLNEASDYIQAAVHLFETDPTTAATLLMSASKKVQLYADRKSEVDLGRTT